MGRARWIIAFAFLLLACSAVPVLAAESGEEPFLEPAGFTPPTSKEEEVAATQVPDAGQISGAIGEAEREEAEEEEWLASPEAEEQREDSKLAFGDLSATESEELLRSVFGEQLEALNSDPGRFLSDAQLVRPLGESGAVVKDEGEGSLLETTVPVRTEDEEGDLAKVDLSLEATPEGFQTENAISDLLLPSSAGEPIQVGEEGFEIAQAGAADSSANRFGDKNLFYPSVLPDTDLMVAANSFGAELFDLLRSKDSPEDLRFDIGVPEGAELRSDEHGGAEVLREGETLTLIPKPYALDAQGSEIPVQMDVEGNSIHVHVAHREGDYAYPALLDPIVEDWVNQGNNWYGGNGLGALTNGAWKFTRNNSNIGSEGGEICCWEGAHAGLLVNMRAAFYGPEQFGQWAYSTANEKVYITHVWLIPFNRADMGCGSAQPHDYAGLWQPGGGGWWNPLWLNYAKSYGNLAGDGNGQSLVIGEGSGPPGVWLACNRLLYAGGVGVWLDDQWGPGITSAGVPSGSWFGDQKPSPVTVSSWDEGLGVQFVKILNEGKGEVAVEKVNNCTGLYGARCPTSHTSQFNITGDSFGEGIRSATVTVSDPTGKTAESHFTTMVDNGPPEVGLSGQLAQATKTEVSPGEGEPDQAKGDDQLSLPVYKLHIEAKDGDPKEDKTKRSGVKNVRVFLDGKEMEVPWKANPSCPATSCAMDLTYTLALSEVLATAGVHKLEVRAEDFVGEVKARHIEFEYFPATGMKDEYVMQHFPLPDGQGNEDEEEHPARPELAVNVMNGNLVYRQRDIDVESPAAVDLEVERFYNSQLPASENTEWGDGWTLAQTPVLEPFKSQGSTDADKANLVSDSGAVASNVDLPTTAGAQSFDPALRSTLTKKSNGGYLLADETGQSPTSVSFDEAGRAEARLTEGPAKIDYSYAGGDLSEIAVEDPATVSVDPEELQEVSPPGKDPSYLSAFGSSGTGDGQLKAPGDVAIDSQGNLWVIDTSNNRVQKFSPEGQFLAKFGSYGSGNGQLNRPTAIAIAANGDLLITDAGNARVERFSAAGAYLSKFGTKGTGNGQFAGSGPEGIAIDAAGNIWVSDTYGGRLEEFSSAGAFLKAAGSPGSGTGQLGEPTGIDIDAGGNVWVADWQNNRLSVFNSSGSYLSQVGSAGSGNGQFSGPDGIEIDAQGNVWVGDQENNRIQRFDVAGQYRGQFGAPGSGPGQLSLSYPMGLASDDHGHLWVTDAGNNRVQKWLLPGVPDLYTSYSSAFGSLGSGAGQLKAPADVAIDAEGDAWILDRANNRVEQFNPKGEFLSQFGSPGTGNGQFNAPSGIAIDSEGNVWVTDTANNRVEKFNEKGEYLSKFGTLGSGNGQLKEPIGIAVAQGTAPIFVVDRGNSRVERFTKAGAYYGQKGSYGSGSQQLKEPSGIAIGAASGESTYTLLIADAGNDRVQRWTPAGAYVGEFGSHGAANGQLDRPEAIDADTEGNVWVGERGNNRVQAFDQTGKYEGRFGTAGSGAGQFSFAYPMGLAADSEGHLWVTDTANNRIQEWTGYRYTPSTETAPSDDDPSVKIQTQSGLVKSVEGQGAGKNTYTHSGDDLTAYSGPQGETKYAYDSAGRMTKVTLPNGTWGEIAYLADNRVKSVSVSVEGAKAKTTTFTYKDDSPRRTTVVPSDAPHVVYDIGDDGSVFKWWNETLPPELDLGGALYDNRERDEFFWEGARLLEARAESAEGIASVDVIANGDTLVNEKICPKPEVIECPKLESEWITESDLHAPGHLQLEVIATDRIGESTSERFWVNVPKPEPLAPGTPVPPRFRDIAKFREDYGLDVVDPVATETERNERIFDLIKAWNEPNTSAGEVARASMDRWGVPMRPRDVAEMEYREWYVETDGPMIENWAYTHFPNSYAGYQIDHHSGGIIRVGFTENQAQRVNELVTQTSLPAAYRVDTFQSVPAEPRTSLESLESVTASTVENDEQLSAMVTEIGIEDDANAVVVDATDVAQTQQRLMQLLGSLNGILVVNQPENVEFQSGRNRDSGRILAGDRLVTEWSDHTKTDCTAGFGAYEDRLRRSDGQMIRARFLLSAGHCANLDQVIKRTVHPGFEDPLNWLSIGHVSRKLLDIPPQFIDALAIRLATEDLAPHDIYGHEGHRPAIGSAGIARRGERLCVSGAASNRVRCGEVAGIKRVFLKNADKRWHGFLRVRNLDTIGGDSGAPVWNARTGASVGLLSAGTPNGNYRLVTPLLNTPTGRQSVIHGALNAPDMEDMHVITDG
jgi:YD repeat-containing protein